VCVCVINNVLYSNTVFLCLCVCVCVCGEQRDININNSRGTGTATRRQEDSQYGAKPPLHCSTDGKPYLWCCSVLWLSLLYNGVVKALLHWTISCFCKFTFTFHVSKLVDYLSLDYLSVIGKFQQWLAFNSSFKHIWRFHLNYKD